MQETGWKVLTFSSLIVMTRGKVKLQLIGNESARRAAFRKRKKGLLKKVEELTKLCDVEACAIVYGPKEAEPELWPSPLGVQRVLERFRAMPEIEQSRKMLNLESFTRERVMKTSEQLKKLIWENKEKRMTIVMHEYLSQEKFVQKQMDLADLDDMGVMLDQKLRKIRARLEALNKAEAEAETV